VQIGNDKATLNGWPDKVRLMQENWIGKSEGVRFAFTHDIKGPDGALIGDGRMYVFTTRADTIMGVTFCAVAPEHPLAQHAAANNQKLAAFIEDCKKGGTTEAELATQEKLGMPTGLFVTHPLTGAQVEVWVGNYVLMSYGDGAVMGVPAHDERDFAFALKYQLPIKQVVAVEGETFSTEAWAEWYGDKLKCVCVNSGVLDGLPYKAAVDKVASLLAEKGLGEKKTTFRLRDWGISRQRYWGTPIPIIHCEVLRFGAGARAGPAGAPARGPGAGRQRQPAEQVRGLPEGRLPLLRPTRAARDRHHGHLRGLVLVLHALLRPDQPGRHGRRRRRLLDADGPVHRRHRARHPAPAVRALLDQGHARPGLVKVDEPFTKLLTQGMVLNHIYSRRTEKGGKEYFWPQDVEHVHDEAGKVIGAKLVKAVGDLPVGTAIDYEGVGTMSKSKNNGVDPQDLIEKYGADTARLYTMFTAPPEATLEWNDAAVEGSYRFLRRVWGFAHKHADALRAATGRDLSQAGLRAEGKKLRRELHLVLKQVSYDYERMQYNTVVSGCMKLLNALDDFAFDGSDGDAALRCEGVSLLVRMLYPVCPHVAHALWAELGYARAVGDLLDAPWPQVDESALVQDEIELVLQVNGKLRGSVTVPASADKAAIEAAALSSEAFLKQANGAVARKVIVVPGRLVNVVV
jgi:leucyl-tRNA synthetase